MSTSVRYTKRRTPGRDSHRRNHRQGRPIGAALWCFAIALLAVACDDGGSGGEPPTPHPTATAVAASPTPEPDLAALIGPRADLPPLDPIDLAARYRQTDGRAAAAKPFAGEANVGDARTFVVIRITAASGPPPIETSVQATLLAKSAHAYFYVDNALGASAAGVQASADAFEAQVWPAVTGVFGEPSAPGVDGDPRIVVLHADLGGVGGYVSSDDLYLKSVRPLSNEAEMIYMDSTIAAGTPSFTVVLAHEFQHLIHERNDGDEEAWVNEGLSEAASGLAGGAISSIDSFEQRPATQLNQWDLGGNLPHYGAGAAFFRFLAAQLGGNSVLGKIARAEADGPAGVEAVLPTEGYLAGSFDRAFAEWIAANLVNAAEGRFANPAPVDVSIDHVLDAESDAQGAAHQFGTDYYALESLSEGEYVLRFEGAPEVEVVSAERDGDGYWWSNAGDAIDTTLTGELDLTRAVQPSLSFRTWYHIERWYDRGYVSVSTDRGATWTTLPGQTAVSEDPARMAYGPGFHGFSGDPLEPRWIDEQVDLAAYAGQKILVRFEYVTDGGTHGQGWAIDDVTHRDGDAVTEIDLSGWDPAGWVRIDRPIEQRWIVRLIAERDGAPVVLDAALDAAGAGELRFDATGLQRPVLAIAGATEGTVLVAPYTVRLDRAP